jgi:hypothetical protein
MYAIVITDKVWLSRRFGGAPELLGHGPTYGLFVGWAVAQQLRPRKASLPVTTSPGRPPVCFLFTCQRSGAESAGRLVARQCYGFQS